MLLLFNQANIEQSLVENRQVREFRVGFVFFHSYDNIAINPCIFSLHKIFVGADFFLP